MEVAVLTTMGGAAFADATDVLGYVHMPIAFFDFAELAGPFVAIKSEGYTTCALAADGTPSCWGASEATDAPHVTCADALFNDGQAAPPTATCAQSAWGSTVHVASRPTERWLAGALQKACNEANHCCDVSNGEKFCGTDNKCDFNTTEGS
jgi:hypothetical protein